MKRKYSRLLRAGLPSLIMLPGMIQVTNAAVIVPDGSGNVVITSAVNATNSGPNNVIVGPAQPVGLHEVRLNDNSFLSPSGFDAIDIRVVDGAGAFYTVNMGLASSIDGGVNNGITTANTIGTAEDLLINANGTITGANAIVGGPGLITVVNNSTITGTAGTGILSTGALDVTNNAGRSITGSTRGIDAGAGFTLNNFGNITGLADDGVRATTGANITNSGIITGNGPNGDGVVADDNSVVNNSGTIISNLADGVETFAGVGTSFTLNNSGLVQGVTNSFFGNASNDTLNLAQGSRLIGDVTAVAGDDTINFGVGMTSAGGLGNSISGDVTGFDVINKDLAGVTFIGLPGDPNFLEHFK